ncbi:MAG TPA: ABC transporter substrate-binding protein [Gammaproteobacteria bacterium]|nr:ABC transporter substrate-binding protein [Gammaproteobacteria bacterium]
MTLKSRERAIICVSLFILVCLGISTGWAQQPKYGGVLKIAFASDILRFNLNQGPPPGYETYWVWNNTHNTLVTLDPDFNIVPDLAEKWDIQEDGRVYVFHLRKGVKFHDGTDFNAEAVKFNFDRILDPATKSWVRVFYDQIDKVEVVDDYTLRLLNKEASGVLLQALAGYFQGVPVGSPTAIKNYGDDWLRHPVGTGPFIFKEWAPGERVVLERNPNYFKKGLPYLDRLEFAIMRDPLAAITALRTAAVDLVARVTVRNVPLIENVPGLVLRTGPDRAPVIALVNMRHKPFDDLRVRRAVAGYGIDRAEIARVVYMGKTKPLVSIIPEGVQDYLDLNELYPYDPAKAKALLKEAGYDEKNPLRYTIITNNDDPAFADIAAMIKEQLAKVGVEIRIQIMDKSTWLDRVIRRYEFEQTIEDFAGLLDINQRSVSFFPGAPSDYVGLTDQRPAELIRQWRRTLDPDGRRRISHEIQRILAENLYWINLCGSPYFQAHRDYVQGYPFYNELYMFYETTWLRK